MTEFLRKFMEGFLKDSLEISFEGNSGEICEVILGGNYKANYGRFSRRIPQEICEGTPVIFLKKV